LKRISKAEGEEMKRILLFAALVCALGLSLPQQSPMAYSQDAQISQIAREAVAELTEKKYASFFDRMDNTMKSTIPVSKLPEIWESVISQIGGFQSLESIRQEKSGSYDVVYATCHFEKAPLDIRLEFNAKRQIAGLYFSPVLAASPASATRISNHEAFLEDE
jgi:uncharacterized protein